MDDIDHTSTMLLSVHELRTGMYVSYLDRPWLDTTLPFRGFEIQTEEELEQLRSACEYVFIHTDRGSHPHGYLHYQASRKNAEALVGQDLGGLATWPVSTSTEEEFSAAREAVTALRQAVIGTYAAASRGESPKIGRLLEVVGPLRNSVERCPDAALYVVRSDESGEYLYRHAVACAVMGLVMGRALGLSDDALFHLAVGCALMDIGKTRVNPELLNRPSTLTLNPNELWQLRQHVAHGLDLLDDHRRSNRQIREIVATHHERVDGRGYPDGLLGPDIPLSGAIAGIIDLFDAMISQRVYGRRATPNEAVRYIRQQRGQDFSEELSDQFVKVFRLYPTGCLVELDDGSVGRVIQQHPTALLTPRVQLVLDTDKQRIHDFCTVDLGAGTATEHGGLCIRACLKPGTYGLDA